MIAHVSSWTTARLLAVLALAPAFVLLIASSAAKPANASSSQWIIAQPHSSWSGWHMQQWNWNGSDQHQNGQDGSGFQHGGGNFHQHGDNHHNGSFDGHHDHSSGFVIINPGFNSGFVTAPAFAGPIFVAPGFVTPRFMGNPPPFIVTQPGFIIGQPFVPGQPHFFVDPHFVHQQAEFVARHPSLGQPFPSHRMHSMRHSSSGMVIRSGTH